MNPQNHLLKMQWAQLKHDEAYHKDVVIMPLAERIKHMALHNAKYVAYFFEALDQGDGAKLTKTLTDAFIIVLASANTLNQDIGRDLGEGAEAAVSFPSLGASLANELGKDGDDYWLVRNFARHTGRLAKVCESWDHLESIVFRDEMKQCNLQLLKVILAEASARQLDIAEAYQSRMRQVETRSIFDQLFREGAGGEA
ncbi:MULTISPECIES: hypothetical protein [unclassified Afipia]|uniref:hypothetical protein n=2 Tax=Afipia TaxID=1033 RepID=UPI0004679B1B|nr:MULTISPECIES: hypothetical protein [unclassified Afipia]